MLDFPQQPTIVHEYVVETEISAAQQELQILDLSFYDVLAGGMCSSETSCRPAQDRIKASSASEKENS